EYYYADHMNAILGVYTTLDEHSDLACNYLETLEKLPISTREPKQKENQSVATPHKKIVTSEPTIKKPRSTFRKLYEHLVEIILFIVDSGCSKHMTENLKLLVNFVEKFLGTVKFGNDQFAPILGYFELKDFAVWHSFSCGLTSFIPVVWHNSDADNGPPMLEKSMYTSWSSRMRLYIKGKENGRKMLNSIENGPLVYGTIKENGVTRPKKYEELTDAEKLQDDCDVKSTNIILQGLPPENSRKKIFYNLDQLRLQFERENLHEVNAKTCLEVLRTQLKEFFASKGMQMQEGNVDIGKALDVGLVVTESSGTESDKPDTSNRSGNDTTHAVDVDSNTTPNSTNMRNNGGKTNQDDEQYHVKSPLLASLIDQPTTDQSYQSLVAENIYLKKTIA
ncbi:hypothetical protein Tco_1087618, partial [Tanacetum coccineum]